MKVTSKQDSERDLTEAVENNDWRKNKTISAKLRLSELVIDPFGHHRNKA